MRPLHLRIATLFLGLALWASACTDDTVDPVKKVCKGSICPCSNEPEVVRVEFDPKEGRAPLTVAFTVIGEDADTDLCEDELLLYHWDFDSDGFEDIKPTKTGRGIKKVFRTPGDYKISMWVTDKDKHASKKSVKFVRVTQNKAPVITSMYLESYSGEAPYTGNLHWQAADADGVEDLAKYELDWGDGTTRSETVNIADNSVSHPYSGVGTFKIKLKVYDQNGASATHTLEAAVSTKVLPSNFIQTIGSSKALWLDDNAGAHYAADFGLYDWMLVADGPIGLKVLRYPLDAYSVSAPTQRPVELIGMSDPGGKVGETYDVVGYGSVAVAAGSDGAFVWNYRKDPDAPSCQHPWDTNCYPGSPTHPAAYCYQVGNPSFFPTQDFTRVELLMPSLSGEVWAVGGTIAGAGESGGISGVRLDAAQNPANVTHNPNLISDYSYDAGTGRLELTTLQLVQWQSLQGGAFQVYEPNTGAFAPIKRVAAEMVDGTLVWWAELAPGLTGLTSGTLRVYPLTSGLKDCWNNAGLETYVQSSAFARSVIDMKISGDYGYVGLANAGFGVYDLGAGFRNRAAMQAVWFLTDGYPWSAMQHTATALAIAESRPVTAMVEASNFSPYNAMLTSPYPNDESDCSEAEMVSAGSDLGATATFTAARAFYPNNRIAFGLANGNTDTNGGLGYKVLSFTGGTTTIEGPLYSQPASWATAYPIGVTSYAKLPGYPGSNPVSFYGSAVTKVARNGRCLNFLNAYAPITQPVGVSFDTAPELFAYLSGYTSYAGLYAFDISNPLMPVQLTGLTTSGASNAPNLGSYAPKMMTFHDEKLYMASDVIAIIDVADPYHLVEARNRFGYSPMSEDGFVVVGTHSRANGAPQFEINDLMMVTPPTNPKGALLTADGPLGVSALYLDPLLSSPPGAIDPYNCQSDYYESSCLSFLPDLQLRHEGRINDIALVDNRYALVAQKMGGVLVFDISSVPYSGDPTFVSHIRTVGNPQSLRYVTDATHKTLFIADGSSLFKIDNFDPVKPEWTLGSTVRAGYNAGYVCVDAAGSRTFACGGYVEGGTNQLRSAVFYGDGITVPSVEIKISDSSDDHDCVYQSGVIIDQSWMFRLWTEWIGNRLFIFGDAGGSLIREVETDGAGHVNLYPGAGGTQIAHACQWNYLMRGSQISTYQNRPGVWRRYYSALQAGVVYVWDMDAYENQVLDGTYDMRSDPTLMGQLDLSTYNDGYIVPIAQMTSLGSYLFIGAGATGAWLLDVSNPISPRLIGRSTQKVPGLDVGALNAIVYPNDPLNLTAGYTYLAMISDNSSSGGILFLRYPQLLPP